MGDPKVKDTLLEYLTITQARFYGEKLARVEGYPSYPGQANFSYISLKNVASRLHEKQTGGSAGSRQVTLFLWQSHATSYQDQLFSYKPFGLPSRIDLVKARQGNNSMGERCFRQAQHVRALLAKVNGSKLTRLGG